MDKQEALKLAMWAKRESEKLTPIWGAPGSPKETSVLESWKVHRPKMYAALEAHKAAVPLAHVLLERAIKSTQAYLLAGMPLSDAREQAEREWLLREPEDEDISEPLPSEQPPSPSRDLPRFLIDEPSPFAPIEELRRFLDRMLELPQHLPEVQDAIAHVQAALADRDQ